MLAAKERRFVTARRPIEAVRSLPALLRGFARQTVFGFTL